MTKKFEIKYKYELIIPKLTSSLTSYLTTSHMPNYEEIPDIEIKKPYKKGIFIEDQFKKTDNFITVKKDVKDFIEEFCDVNISSNGKKYYILNKITLEYKGEECTYE